MALPLPTVKQNALVPKLAGDAIPKLAPKPVAPPAAPGVPKQEAPIGPPAPATAVPAPAYAPGQPKAGPVGTQINPAGPLTETVGTLTPPGPVVAPPTVAPPAAVPAPQTPLAAPTVAPTLTPTDPDNPLTAQTIAPASGVDHFRLAQERFDTFAQGSDPAYQAALRDAKRVGAAAGGLGSGMLRTSLGDYAANRANALDVEKRRTFADAIENTVGDARFATGVAQQQQGFQSDQQRQAFENELRRMGFDDDLLNSAFGRALMQWQAGNAGGTGSGTILSGANQAGNTGRDAMTALEEWLAERNRAGTSAPTPPGALGGFNPYKPPPSYDPKEVP